MRLFHHPEVLVGQWLQEANGVHRDVQLVCDDGTLSWSSLLLASESVPALAESLKSLDRCSFCVKPTVLLLPGIRYDHIIATCFILKFIPCKGGE